MKMKKIFLIAFFLFILVFLVAEDKLLSPMDLLGSWTVNPFISCYVDGTGRALYKIPNAVNKIDFLDTKTAVIWVYRSSVSESMMEGNTDEFIPIMSRYIIEEHESKSAIYLVFNLKEDTVPNLSRFLDNKLTITIFPDANGIKKNSAMRILYCFPIEIKKLEVIAHFELFSGTLARTK
ncbi:MAG: hypothetical protein JW969_20205 [Spirochaetales bacterium]|nr:hypothetical protein [Spirochaetales bacterium]